ncbi:hypothetical protein [Variovorax sp. GB4P3]|uniref:hypothetical protein n=1 Tax=Variovorax sp. GB4P3 TaxID=3443738 RepID=UPI003F499300
MASALSFAHLGGLVARKNAKASAEEDDDKKEQDRENTNAKGAKAEGDDDERKKRDDETDDEYKARIAKLDDDEAAEGDDPDKKDDDADDKAKADDGDDKDEEMRGKSATAQARLREQARCAAIFGSKAAAGNPVLAANLAFKTRMGRAEALAVLEASPAAATAAPANAHRSARNPGIAAGGASTPSGPQAAASSWDRAFAQVSPTRRK